MTDISREEALAHFGIKGMRWGVRKEADRSKLVGLGPDKIIKRTASGETLTLTRYPPNVLNKTLARLSQNYVDGYNKGAFLDIRDSTGKKIGVANFWEKTPDELYLNYLEINKSSRGKGYATAVMSSAKDIDKEHGYKRLSLDVPGNSPDARHIYEKLGFKVVDEVLDKDDWVWGGLTKMEMLL